MGLGAAFTSATTGFGKTGDFSGNAYKQLEIKAKLKRRDFFAIITVLSFCRSRLEPAPGSKIFKARRGDDGALKLVF